MSKETQQLFDSPATTSSVYADVMLPVPLHRLFTYKVPSEIAVSIKVGCRVIVPFGKQKIQTGIIGKIHGERPEQYDPKEILELMEETPIIHQPQIDLYHWISSYYMCTLGEVINAAIPSGLKLSSESFVQLNPDYAYLDHLPELNDREYELIKQLEVSDQLSYSDIASLLGLKSIYHIIKSLSANGAILLFEQVKEKYKPKIEKWIRLNPHFLESEGLLEEIFEKLEKKPKQLDVLLKYLKEVTVLENPSLNQEGMRKAALLGEDISQSSLKTLIKNGVLNERNQQISRFEKVVNTTASADLSALQQIKHDEIKAQFEEYQVVLLHGVTGSGKTEIYIKLIEEQLTAGKQVLYVLPEIALTTQIVNRLRKVFGDRIGVYHSKYSDNERVEVWQGLLKGEIDLVIGVRSATLLPFDNLGLVIVDEEYESTFKQYDPAPRYHARDLAILFSHFSDTKILLGTATPSLETYTNVQENKYGLVEIEKRFNELKLPELILVDIKEQRKKRLMRNEFTSVLIEEIEQALANKEQVILFQNRRGYSPLLSCETCGHIPKCHQCSVSLTYHQYGQELRCHYCGYKEPLPQTCEACDSPKLKTIGFGTEKIEEDIKLLFPNAVIGRMDLDTTRSKYGYQNILEAFELGQIDILVGTQMVTKGLDFDRVGLVGVIDADKMIHYPDFRSHERAFQLITQVSGRAGRRSKRGKVVIQTYDPAQEVLKHILRYDFKAFYKIESSEREKYHYPPHYRLIRVIVKHKEPHVCKSAAEHYTGIIRTELGKERVLGPEEPVIARIRNQYLQIINVKIEKQGVSLKKVKSVLYNVSVTVSKIRDFKNVSIVFDVDPQ
ncbi:MAG: primosomal protein N' [Bacteroidota bacterium]